MKNPWELMLKNKLRLYKMPVCDLELLKSGGIDVDNPIYLGRLAPNIVSLKARKSGLRAAQSILNYKLEKAEYFTDELSYKDVNNIFYAKKS